MNTKKTEHFETQPRRSLVLAVLLSMALGAGCWECFRPIPAEAALVNPDVVQANILKAIQGLATDQATLKKEVTAIRTLLSGGKLKVQVVKPANGGGNE